MILFLLFVSVESSGLPPYFTATRRSEDWRIGDFVVQLNGRHPMLFDTGGFPSYIKSSSLADRGYDVTGSRIIPLVTNLIYPYSSNVQSDFAVDDQFTIGTIGWKQVMPIVTSGGKERQIVGVLGAALYSPITNAVRVFTTVPYPDHFRIHTGPMELSMSNCFSVPLTRLGLEKGHWIISGSIKIGNSQYRLTDLLVDTGFPGLALSTNMWEAFKKRMRAKGAIYSVNESKGYYHVFYNCVLDSIPTITYKLSPGWTISIAASSYVRFKYNGTCDVNVLSHDTHQYYENLSFIGVPVLTGAIVQFNSETQSITFCEDKNIGN